MIILIFVVKPQIQLLQFYKCKFENTQKHLTSVNKLYQTDFTSRVTEFIALCVIFIGLTLFHISSLLNSAPPERSSAETLLFEKVAGFLSTKTASDYSNQPILVLVHLF